MASATGIPDATPFTSDREEDEPLLGQPGDASQPENKSIQFNLVIGTAIIAQAGIWVLTAIVWSAVFSADLILFSAHPLFNSAGILLTTQAILILQPTHSPSQKHLGTNIHATLNLTAFASLIAGLVIIEYNKFAHHAPAHFNSTHGILGLVTYVLLVVQVLIGLAQFYTPSLFGSVNNAKSIYKYHRMSGYLILVMFFATVYAATYTAFNIDKLHIQLWAVVVASVLVLVGVVPRIKKQKLGL